MNPPQITLGALGASETYPISLGDLHFPFHTLSEDLSTGLYVLGVDKRSGEVSPPHSQLIDFRRLSVRQKI